MQVTHLLTDLSTSISRHFDNIISISYRDRKSNIEASLVSEA